jgi:2-methylaconitate cis-trans-isomerase PrpF
VVLPPITEGRIWEFAWSFNVSVNVAFGSGQVNTTDAAAATNVANTIGTITSITLQQPAGAVAKTINIAINGTSLTAANVRYNVVFAAGVQSVTIYPGWVLTGTQTINISATAGANEATYHIDGYRDAA